MKIKVCGMKNPENITELVQLPIDMMGLIFYEKSPRFAGDLNPNILSIVPKRIRKVGVFVNKPVEEVIHLSQKYDLQMIQLHGNESIEYCEKLIEMNYEIIKVFCISDKIDNDLIRQYEHCCNYILFDTKTTHYGGSGKQFDWNLLNNYTGSTPYFLSGGICLEDIETIKKINDKKLYAIDLNSQFEIEPGVKDIEKLKRVKD